jgi:hypothetical protein
MKTKFAAYAIAAVLIGFAVMMLPLALETGPPTYQPQLQPSFTNAYPDGKNAGEQRDQLDNTYGLTSQPSNLTSSSLILLVGLIIAFAAYIIVKKQVNPPPAFSYWYKPF